MWLIALDLFRILNKSDNNNNNDNTSYTFSQELDTTLKRLKNYTNKIFEWLYKKGFKSNGDKCNFIATSKSQEKIQIGKTSLTSANRVKSQIRYTYWEAIKVWLSG